MAKVSKQAARKAVTAAVARLTSSTGPLTDKTKLDSLGLSGDLRKVLNSSVVLHARLDGIPLAGRPKGLDGDTIGELTNSLASIVSSGPARAAAARYPLPAIKADVKLVMARIKHVNPAEIKDTDKLKAWNFTRIDCRGLAQMLNLYYYNERNMVLTPWLHPSEIDSPEMTVNDVAAVVDGHNPGRRSAAAASPF
ncbi:hypothetical protein [Bradyrhizobium japonicum]|uniref:hypothetical protein n=1 Tax=Bradyrhizobium japonicum TaxID=375 RepID=UPI001BAA5EA4|nr:hypothetical protein [Bradyrhizobium japonicum]MBR0911497.1 hypothetical protein [Bradyrhizobium japonicum]